MYNYEQFRDALVDNLSSILGNDGYEIKIHEKKGINQISEYVSAFFKNGNELSVVPAVDIRGAFENYIAGKRFDNIVNNIAEILVRETGKEKNIKEMFSLDLFKDKSVLDNIVMDVINTQMNMEMLQNVPNKRIEDLSIVYRVDLTELIGCKDNEVATVLIDNKLQKIIGADTEMLHETALKNMERKYPVTITPMSEIMTELTGGEDFGLSFGDDFLYVMKGNNYNHGASAIVYCQDKLNEFIEKTGKDLYILPSSIYEVLVLTGDKNTDVNELKDIVCAVNNDAVKINERLSDNVYKYSVEKRKFELATKPNNERIVKRGLSR